MLIQYIARRLVMLPIIMLIVSAVVFVGISLAPGDPVQLAFGADATPTQIAQFRAQLGLDQPLYVQYLIFLSNALRGNLGQSYLYRLPVLYEILSTAPASLELAIVAITISTLPGIAIGVFCAIRVRSVADHLSRVIATIGVSMPTFLLGLILILLFAVYFRILPTSGFGSPGSIILPAITLGAYNLCLVARFTRSSMLDVLGQDYITTARAKGLAETVVLYKHALKNALVPVVTVIGINFAYLLGGAVVTETVFAWPGVGRLLMTAILARDYPLVRGIVLLLCGFIVLINLIVDICYVYINPRIHYD